MTVVLGVDFGTSNTAAALHWPDGRTRVVLFDGSPLLPSVVCADPDGTGKLFVGRDAVQAATFHPAGAEFHPKQRVDDVSVLLSDVEYPVVDLFAAVLRRVVAEAATVAGGAPGRMVVTYPAGWGEQRRAVLRAAAAQVVPQCDLAMEPVAAAAHFAAVAGLAVGSSALVYDLGGGTFDASVVRRTADGYALLATEGISGVGGLDLDAAIVAHLGDVFGGRAPELWQRLASPASDVDRRARRQLWDAVRAAKETLSRHTSTRIALPLFDEDAPLGREQLDALARPLLDRTIEASRAALDTAAVPAGALNRIYLVGGASRYPLVVTLLHQAFGVTPTVVEQPELAVAEGAVLPLAELVRPDAPPVASAPTGGRRWSRRVTVLAAGIATVGVATAAAFAFAPDRKSGGGAPASLTSSPSPTTTPSPSPTGNELVDPCLIGSWQLTAWDETDVDFWGVDVDLHLQGKGWITHYSAEGSVWHDLRKGVTTRGRSGSTTYDNSYSGVMRWRFSGKNGVGLYSKGTAKGSWVIRVNGEKRYDEPMTVGSSSGSQSYVCSATQLTVNEDKTSKEFVKISGSPAPYPK
ncbi:Hsp70 protein [Asanoa hainanensis]|uniref:Hsp70 protein n=1 Tax=Asanoa hainanensis TaxID=560556 RepID=A0A239IX13_9ACTN|nr:Hsp70 family protein [Asanoa hainanensis]SNS97563.1 Hsp70 protein [Asanoa hainanensis]